MGDVNFGKYGDGPYRGYVIILAHRKKEGDGWIEVEHAYMPVDGRVAECAEEHAKAQKRYSITSKFEAPDGVVICDAVVESEIRGKAEARAVSRKAATGPEASNPYEVAQTSAIGRALGYLGYGLIPGSGLASADEVKAARVADAKKTGTLNGRGKKFLERSTLIKELAKNPYYKTAANVCAMIETESKAGRIKPEMSDAEFYEYALSLTETGK